jgi:hypothetical protein
MQKLQRRHILNRRNHNEFLYRYQVLRCMVIICATSFSIGFRRLTPVKGSLPLEAYIADKMRQIAAQQCDNASNFGTAPISFERKNTSLRQFRSRSFLKRTQNKLAHFIYVLTC